MKTHLDIKHEGTLGTADLKTIKFDEDATEVLEGILIDLYGDSELATIREIATNAADSHVAAGNLRPIEVELPSALRMTYVVRDHGVGLDPDDIERVFKYGASDKRDTDEAVGMLGLGLKAPLAYTSQFTMVAVKHGTKSTVLVTRKESGGGAYQIIDTCATDEPNGVEITIPTTGYTNFCAKANFFFRFWERGSVLVNGVLPTNIFPGPRDLVLDPDVFITTHLEHDYVVMGNVPYEVPWEEDALVRGDSHAVVRVPIGSVNFTPSREALNMTKRTKEVLHEARTFINGGLERRVQNEIDAAPTHTAALRVAASWNKALKLFPNLNYRGESIPSGFMIPKDGSSKQHLSWEVSSNWNKVYGKFMFEAEFLSRPTTLHVVGSKIYGLRATVKDKIKLYIQENNLDVKHAVLYPEALTDGKWLDDCLTVDYSVIREIKLPDDGMARKARTKTSKGSYRVVMQYGDEKVYPADEIIQNHLDRVVYMGAGIQFVKREEVRKRVTSGHALVIVEKPQLNGFLKDIPNAVSIEQHVLTRLIPFVNLTPVEQFLCHASTWDHTPFAKLPGGSANVLDPEVRDLIQSVSQVIGKGLHVEFAQLRWLVANFCGVAPRVKLPETQAGFNEINQRVQKLSRRYPLASSRPYGTTPKHVLDYINAMHLAHACRSIFTNPTRSPKQGETK